MKYSPLCNREIYALPQPPQTYENTHRRLYAQTPLSRGVTGTTFHDTEKIKNKTTEKSTHFPTGIAIQQPSNNAGKKKEAGW